MRPAQSALPPDLDAAVETVRAFNRVWTRRIGVIGDSDLYSPFSLAEARILYEVANGHDVAATDLAAGLGLDAGYLSRLLTRLEKAGLLTRTAGGPDGRRRTLELTPAGRQAADDLRARTRTELAVLLETFPDTERAGLVAAMAAATRRLGGGLPAPIVLRPHRIGDLGWVVHRHGRLYAEEHGWDIRFEALVAEILAGIIRNFDPARDGSWIAESDGAIVGSVFVVRTDDPDTAKLRLLLVEPAARGRGLGRLLVDTALACARERGYRRMVLWTNDPLVTARRIYERAGFSLVSEQSHSDFGPEMTGQMWEKVL
ncbi:bifunctional helix-turn-helix transcriptional regulator/GNAT family N-acetyltransferase [Methylobrevis pamukkalensis]|nr:bifunctional helix-turn-helix transcriptional regulator/GNAT family N-acetyltransferase [Methylobrevis pamukkalensis]